MRKTQQPAKKFLGVAPELSSVSFRVNHVLDSHVLLLFVQESVGLVCV